MEEECLLAFDDQEDPVIIERIVQIKGQIDKLLLKITPFIDKTHELDIFIFGPCDRDIQEQESRLTDLKQNMARNPMTKHLIKKEFDKKHPNFKVDTKHMI